MMNSPLQGYWHDEAARSNAGELPRPRTGFELAIPVS